MVHYQRYVQPKKGQIGLADEDGESHATLCGEDSVYYQKGAKPKLFSLLFLSLLSCSLIVVPRLLSFPSTLSLLYSLGRQEESPSEAAIVSLCSLVSNGSICCDRTSIRSDVCIMKGDIRTDSSSSSVFLHVSGESPVPRQEMVRPYTRKWENTTMSTVGELNLVSTANGNPAECDVVHEFPAVFFSTGGYTGNVYHEFNDGILPLYITSQHLNKKVVFVILEYHSWWATKYGDILSQLSDYKPIDFSGDKKTHCFPEATVGLRIHDELAVDPSLTKGSRTIKDFRDVLERAYLPRIRGLIQDEEREAQIGKVKPNSSSSSPTVEIATASERNVPKKPRLAIISRKGSRCITNENLLVKMAEKLGFEVEILRPDQTTELAKIYRVLNSSDVMIGVHGAAMTHFLFMKPGSVFIQVIPLGTDWAADTYYGGPAKKLGLKYIGYNIVPSESSLRDEYREDDQVLTDPSSVNSRGWEFTKKIYLDRQKVTLNLPRFRKHLVRSYHYTIAKRNREFIPDSTAAVPEISLTWETSCMDDISLVDKYKEEGI